jgi:hypothetical protein
MVDKNRLFASRKPKVRFPVDLEAEVRAKGKAAQPYLVPYVNPKFINVVMYFPS